LAYLRQLRDVEQDLDIFFVVNYAGKTEHADNDAYRYAVMRQIKRYPGIRSKVGFVSRSAIDGDFSDLQVQRLALKEYLAGLARAKVSIYVRGLHDCLSFKFCQLLALGKPIAGQPIANNAGELMSLDHLNEQFAFEEPHELVSRAIDLVRDRETRRAIADSNASTFDTKLTPSAAVSRVLEGIKVAGD
jgi:hypothetical protein